MVHFFNLECVGSSPFDLGPLEEFRYRTGLSCGTDCTQGCGTQNICAAVDGGQGLPGPHIDNDQQRRSRNQCGSQAGLACKRSPDSLPPRRGLSAGPFVLGGCNLAILCQASRNPVDGLCLVRPG